MRLDELTTSLRDALDHEPAPDVLPARTLVARRVRAHQRRRAGAATLVAATVLVAMVLVVGNARGDDPETLPALGPAGVPLLVPDALPPGLAPSVVRDLPDPHGGVAAQHSAVYARGAQPPNRASEAFVVQFGRWEGTLDRTAPDEVSAQATDGIRYASRTLWGRAFVWVQSWTLPAAQLEAIARSVRLSEDAGRLEGLDPPAGYSARPGGDTVGLTSLGWSYPVNLALPGTYQQYTDEGRDFQSAMFTGRVLAVGTAAGAPADLDAWRFVNGADTEVTVRGRPGAGREERHGTSPPGTAVNGRPLATTASMLAWIEPDGGLVALFGGGYTLDELRAAAEDLRPPTAEEWSRLQERTRSTPVVPGVTR